MVIADQTSLVPETVRRQRAAGAPQSRELASLLRMEEFSIPATLRELKVADLAVSGRLKRVLQRLGAVHLADIDGLSVKDLLLAWNCGPGTVIELATFLEQASVAENQEPKTSWEPAALIETIETLIDGLPARYKEILLLRFGGSFDVPQTLEEIGAKFQLTRERVRQLVDRSIEQIRRRGGEGLRTRLAQLKEVCRRKVCPLTPVTLKHWLEPFSTGTRFSFGLYVALLGWLEPAIPAWPRGRVLTKRRIGRSDVIESTLERVLRDELQGMGISKALTEVQKQCGCEEVQPAEFLATLQHCDRFEVEFSQPDAPVVRRARLTSLDIAFAILQRSEKILTLQEIIERARSLPGARAPELNPRTLACLLRQQRGFYLLGPRSYGLRRHSSIPEALRKRVQKDFRLMLRRENRPMLTADALKCRRFKWAARTNRYELACILREDSGFVDLGRFLFALAEWGFKERESVGDLITRVLESARRPLTSGQIRRRLQKFRSISHDTVSQGLRLHSEIEDFGFGRYGLKTWGRSPSRA